MSSTVDAPEAEQQGEGKKKETVETVVVRFCGDSGDGMQLVGTQMTNVSAVYGNDVSTLPDFPAEIRAPAGTLAGVSGYQLCFSNHDIFTPGDAVDTLVSMNPCGVENKHCRPQARRHAHRQRRRVRQEQCCQGDLRIQSARRRRPASAIPSSQSADDSPDARRG